MLVLRVIPQNTPTLLPSVSLASFETVVSIQGIAGSCGGCREVRECCGIHREEIGRGGCKGGTAAKREGLCVTVAFVVNLGHRLLWRFLETYGVVMMSIVTLWWASWRSEVRRQLDFGTQFWMEIGAGLRMNLAVLPWCPFHRYCSVCVLACMVFVRSQVR